MTLYSDAAGWSLTTDERQAPESPREARRSRRGRPLTRPVRRAHQTSSNASDAAQLYIQVFRSTGVAFANLVSVKCLWECSHHLLRNASTIAAEKVVE
jgi:hypothetical protein